MIWLTPNRYKVAVLVSVVATAVAFSFGLRSGIEVKRSVLTHASQTKAKLDTAQSRYDIQTTDLSRRLEEAVRYLDRVWAPFTPWMTHKVDKDLTAIDAQIQREYVKKHDLILSTILANESKLTRILHDPEDTDMTVLSEGRAYLATRSADIIELNKIANINTATLDRALLISSELESHMDRFQSIILSHRKKEFADLLATILSDIDLFLAFFKKRVGYDAQILALGEARTQIGGFQQLQPDLEGLAIIEKQVKTELYPLLASAQSSRDTIQQQEQVEYQRKLIELAKAQTFIPEAPVKEGKVIFVSLATQRLYAYENGTSLFSYPVPVTTGKSNHATVTGEFQIFQKSTDFTMRSPFPDEPYTLFVKYWMPFYSGYGLHDAPWRGSFGGQEFTQNGTHGCVNMREVEVAKIFEWAPVGTKVIVQ